MDVKPSGYLPFAVRPEPEDRLIFSPVYIFPVEILERSLMQGLKYLYQVVLVDGYNGRTTLCNQKKLIPCNDFSPEDVNKEYLELKISPTLAPEIAEWGAVPSDFRSWKKIIKNRHVAVCTSEMKLVWRVYAVRDNEVLDTFTGEIIRSAGLMGMLFN